MGGAARPAEKGGVARRAPDRNRDMTENCSQVPGAAGRVSGQGQIRELIFLLLLAKAGRGLGISLVRAGKDLGLARCKSLNRKVRCFALAA